MSKPPDLCFAHGFIGIVVSAPQKVSGPQCQFCGFAQGLGEQCPICDMAFEIQTTMTAHALGLKDEE